MAAITQVSGPASHFSASSISMQSRKLTPASYLSVVRAKCLHCPQSIEAETKGGVSAARQLTGSSFLGKAPKWHNNTGVERIDRAATGRVQAAASSKDQLTKRGSDPQIERRQVLVAGGAAAAGLLLPSQGGAAPVVLAPQDLATCYTKSGCCVNVSSNGLPARVPFTPLAGPVRTRKATRNLSDLERRMFNRAYQLLRQKAKEDPTDPRWYLQQANVHCAYCNMFYQYSFEGRQYPLQIHSSWLFLPWHRLYLHFHERILISLLKNDPEGQFSSQADNFALPFWNYDVLDATSPDSRMAAIYTSQSGLPGLFDPNRNARGTSELVSFQPSSEQSPAATIAQNTAVMRRNVLQATTSKLFFGSKYRAGDDVPKGPGQLELSPHNPVHVWVGGDMIDFGTAGRDPIFYGHHGNLDRLWSVWLNLPGGNRVNFTDRDWLDASFLFYDENRKLVEAKVSDAIDTRASLRYAYEDVPIPWATAARPQPLQVSPTSRSLLSADVSQTVDLGPATSESPAVPLNKQPLISSIQRSPPADLKTSRDPGVIGGALRNSGVSKLAARVGVRALTVPDFQEEVLVLQGVSYPSNKPTHFNVFINLPDANPQTPLNCAEYAGSFAAVAHGAMDMTSQVDVRLSISNVLEDLGLTDSSDFTVTIVPVADDGSDQEFGDVSIKGIAIEYDS